MQRKKGNPFTDERNAEEKHRGRPIGFRLLWPSARRLPLIQRVLTGGKQEITMSGEATNNDLSWLKRSFPSGFRLWFPENLHLKGQS